jgi:hypothetical protein
MSLDGFIAGLNDGSENPLGNGTEWTHQRMYGLVNWRKLHGLASGQTNRDSEILEEPIKNTGEVFPPGRGARAPWPSCSTGSDTGEEPARVRCQVSRDESWSQGLGILPLPR